MIYQIRFTEPAKNDLREITTYLRRNAGDPVARRLSEELIAKAESLRTRPMRQRERSEFGLGLRAVTVRDYMIVYHIGGDTVSILRILHGSRDITEKMFR